MAELEPVIKDKSNQPSEDATSPKDINWKQTSEVFDDITNLISKRRKSKKIRRTVTATQNSK
ncbi:hypothetical protein ACFL0F_00525 [Patescibacteria group bacterium]